MKRVVFSVFLVVTLLSLLAGSAAAQPAVAKDSKVKVSNVSLPPGYFLKPLAKGLDFPTALATFGDKVRCG